MAQYQVRLVNNTPEAHYFAIYQKYPQVPGLTSVAFQVCGVGPGGTNLVTWNMNFGTAITEYNPNTMEWTSQQVKDADLGSAYEVKLVEGDIPTINSSPVGSAGDGIIQLTNATNRSLNVGFNVGGSLVAVQEVNGGETSEYYAHPTYYVALYRHIKKGSSVDHNISMVGPVQLKFDEGCTSYVVEAVFHVGRYILKDPVPVPAY
jgi:hypothetical protein